jgi:coenzyme F420 hydrogenase subunit beta
MKVFGSGELRADVLENELCIGCGACVSLCPYFRSYEGKTAMLFPCLLSEGRCFAYCPKVEVDLDEVSRHIFDTPYSMEPLGRYLTASLSRAGKKAAPGNYQAGGTVSALMQFSLEKGKIDAAVLTGREGLLAEPRIVTDPAEVTRYASSKYTAAPTCAGYNRAVQEGFRKIGVVATPCQALALAQMRVNALKDPANADAAALVVGLFCTWALDYRKLRGLLEERVDISTITKFDIPPPPAEVMEIHTSGGIITIPLGEVRERVHNACSYCCDMTAEFADISVGVVEGMPGMNTLLVRTLRGMDIVEEAVREGYLETRDIPDANLEGLRVAAGNKKRRAFVKVRDMGMINTDEGGRRAYIRIDSKTIEGM